MKKPIVLIAIIMLSGMLLSAQSVKNKIEVLYFKANLSCCKSRACNALEAEIQNIISENYPDSSVVLTEIKLVDEANKALIEKYNAKSQTVIIVRKKKKKEFYVDVSDIVQSYVQNQNKETLKQEVTAKISEIKEKKK